MLFSGLVFIQRLSQHLNKSQTLGECLSGSTLTFENKIRDFVSVCGMRVSGYKFCIKIGAPLHPSVYKVVYTQSLPINLKSLSYFPLSCEIIVISVALQSFNKLLT